MDDIIIISNLNDFIFCPASIYFHKLYGSQDNLTYQSSYQINGSKAHESVDNSSYSTKKSIITALDVYSDKYKLSGKIDIYDMEKQLLIERKKHISKIYYGVFHKCFYMRKSLVCDLMEPIRPVVDYQVRKSINLGQCKENDFEVVNNRWCLKYKSNPQYIQFLMNAILEYKDDIFLYIQQYYRFFMKRKSVSEIPVFIIH